MPTIDDLLSPENVRRGLESFHGKRDGCGPDGMRVSELDAWWYANGAQLCDAIRRGTYRPGVAVIREIVTHSGKRREIASINVVDRMVERLLQQVLAREVEPLLTPCCLAYRPGKGPLDAAMLARLCVEDGCQFVCEIDFKDYFASVDHNRLLSLSASLLGDDALISLLCLFLRRGVERNGQIQRANHGLLQGSSISAPLSNLYLNQFDYAMQERQLRWFRFCDNICAYTQTQAEASSLFEELTSELKGNHLVSINSRKSGVFRILDRRVLGYDLSERDGRIEVQRHSYSPRHRYDQWHASSVSKETGVYHIVQDGIINRRDYSLLFESSDERHHIPVEVTSQLNVYGNVTVAPPALRTLCESNIRVAYVDEYGNLMGTLIPAGHSSAADVFLRQCQIYSDDARRLVVARALEIAGIHNMRANLRYYEKRGRRGLKRHVEFMTDRIVQANEARSVDELQLIEAQARKRYYSAFSIILNGVEFDFTHRTRRPPRDPGNAMVSFGNTLLYNLILQDIWKTSLDPKIGIVHATNRRSYSLNLDLADVFKPIVVDRVIFSLVNRREIRVGEHFHIREDGGVLLGADGKRLFISRFEEKLDGRVSIGGRSITYRRLIADEVLAFQRMVRDGERYRPYKYY